MHVSYNEYILVSAEKKNSRANITATLSPKREKGVIKLRVRF